MNEAQLRGIDLEELQSERFTHPEHYAMLKGHFDRVKEYEIRKEVETLRQKLETYPEIIRDNAEKLRKGKRVRTPITHEPDYVFTDIQLRIAEEILERHTEGKNRGQTS